MQTQTNQDRLFENILTLAMKGKMILWAGAGLSKEAGYPLGGELAQKLIDGLPESEKGEPFQDLMKIGDYYVNREPNGRDKLIEILKKEFLKEPKPSESHEIIRKLDFFNTIITTNYDEVFEKYLTDISIIRTSKELSRKKSNGRSLIKIHGDLKYPKKLILTEGDYARIYGSNNSSPFLSKVISELTEKSVLFVGYGFNDLNIRGIFDRIHKKLKHHTHPKFFAAPNLSKAEKDKLVQYNIHYIDLYGHEFFKRLYGLWKEKGFKHFGDEDVSSDHLMNALKSEGISISISIKEKGKNVMFIPDPNKAWDLSFGIQNKELEKRISDWQIGLGPDDLIIPKDSIIHANVKIGDFVIGDKSILPDLRFQRMGKTYKSIRIYFEESKVELENLKVTTYNYGEKGIKFKIIDENGTLELILPIIRNSNLKYDGKFYPKSPSKSISGLLKWHEAIYSLGNGESFIIYSEEKPCGFNFKNGSISRNLEGLNRNRLIYQVLRMVEEKFKIRFMGIKEEDIFNDNTLAYLQNFLDLFKTKKLKKEYPNGIPIKNVSTNPENDIIPLINKSVLDGYLVIILRPFSFNFLNHEIPLGARQLFIRNPILESSLENPDELILKSSNNEYFEMFEAFGMANTEGYIKLND